MKAAGRFLIPFLLAVLVAGCTPIGQLHEEPLVEPPEVTAGDSGTLQIDFSSIFASARTLLPPVAMTISRCDITGTLEGGTDSFTDSVTAGQTFSRAGLAAGLWTIAVDAVNPDGIVIGRGETTVRITAGSTTSAQVTIYPLAGDGTLDLTLRWDKKAFTTEVINATLSPALATGGTLVFALQTRGQFREGVYLNAAVPAGYYILTIQLVGDGVQVWGTMEAVRILAGQTTSHTWTYTAP